MDQLGLPRHVPSARAPVIPPAADKVRRAIVTGLLVVTAIVALQAASQAINFGFYNLRFHAFDADHRFSVFGVVSLLAQLGVAAASVWRGGRVERHRWAWFALGGIVAALVPIRSLTAFNAAALAVPLACVFCLLCWLTWHDPAAARFVVWTGLILMVTSLLLHKVGLAADASLASDYSWGYQITGIVKHGAELAGWTLVVTGIIAGIEDRPRRKSPAAGIVTPRHKNGRPATDASARGLVHRNRL
jgi:hypothetical protein